LGLPELKTLVLRKVVAFIGLLGVIYALALQHGLFDRANAASPGPGPQAEATAVVPAPAQPQPKPEVKSATKRLHSRH
jgi:hypothetical protein